MLPYICQAWAWGIASSVVRASHSLENHLFLHSSLLYIGAISGERQVAKQSVLRNTTFTVNDHCPTVTAVSTAQKHLQLEICLRNNSLKSYFHLKFLCIDTDPDYRLNPKANNTCTYT